MPQLLQNEITKIIESPIPPMDKNFKLISIAESAYQAGNIGVYIEILMEIKKLNYLIKMADANLVIPKHRLNGSFPDIDLD